MSMFKTLPINDKSCLDNQKGYISDKETQLNVCSEEIACKIDSDWTIKSTKLHLQGESRLMQHFLYFTVQVFQL